MLAGFGCPPPSGEVGQDVPPPPPRTLDEIIETIEGNAALLDRALWSNSVTVTARFTDENGKEHVYNLDSNLLFQPPRDLRMDLRPGLGDQVMQIGSNTEDYWIWIEPEMKRMWWGRHRHAGKRCAGSISVRPDQLVMALGLGGLPRAGDGLIGPARKYGKTYDILYYLRESTDVEDQRSSGGYWLAREYWVERSPPYMVRIVQFRDRLGRVLMSAFLDDQRRAWEGGPLVAHSISIIWHLDEGKFTMSMGRVRGVPPEKVNADAFARPEADDLPSGIEAVIQVDSDCD
ncbi:MAG: hypothetical protein JXQ75_10295 [Phycisphaerae bacterium]|nr:hypothetical protein [Phycisphaerae bacterium]